VFIVNLLVILVGLAMAVLGTWVLVSDYLYIGSGWENMSSISCAVLFVGFLIILLGFLACCGAITNSQCLLGMFVISLLAIMVVEASVAVLVYLKEVDYRTVLRDGVHEIVTEKYHPNNTATVMYWDTIQQELECCGSSGPVDWAGSLYNGWQYHNMKEIGIGAHQAVMPFNIPSSCCRNLADPLCSSTITPKFRTRIDENIYYTEGCLRKGLNILSSNNLYLYIVTSIIIVIEILGVIFSTCICCTMRKIEDMKP